MATKYFNGTAIAVQKQIRLDVGGSFDRAVKIGLGSKLLTIDPFTIDDLVSQWNSSTDALLSEIACVGSTADGYCTFTHNTAGQDFELTMLIGDETGVTFTDASYLDEYQRLTFANNCTGGTFTISFNGQTTAAITYNAADSAVTAANILSALEALSNVGVGDVQVTAESLVSFKVGFANGQYKAINVPLMTVDYSSITGGNAAVSITTVQEGNLGTNEIQEISIPGYSSYTAYRNEIQEIYLENAGNGTFTLTLDGYGTTGAIPWNANRLQLQTIMRTAFGTGNVDVLGAALPGGPLRIYFKGTLSNLDLPALTADVTNLTASATLDVTVTRHQSATADTDMVISFPRPGTIASGVLGDYNLVFLNENAGYGHANRIVSANIDGNSNAAAIKAAIIGSWDYESPSTTKNEDYGYGPGSWLTTNQIDVTGDLTTDNLVITIKERLDNFKLGVYPRLDAILVKKSDSTVTNITPVVTTGFVAGANEVQYGTVGTPLDTVGNIYLKLGATVTEAIPLSSNLSTVAAKMQWKLRKALGAHNLPPANGFLTVRITAHPDFGGGYGSVVPTGKVVPWPFTVTDLQSAFASADLSTLFASGPSDYNILELIWVGPMTGQTTWGTFVGSTDVPTTYAEFMALCQQTINTYSVNEGEYDTGSYQTNMTGSSNPISVSWDEANTRFVFTFGGFPYQGVGVDQSLIEFQSSVSGGGTPEAFITTTQEGGSYTAYTVEAGSTFDLGIRKASETTVTWVNDIAYDATAAEIEGAVNAVLGTGSVSCSGGPLPGTPVVMEFAGGTYDAISMAPTLYRLAFSGTAGNSATNEVIRTARTPEIVTNVYDFTIIPGRGTLGLNYGSDWNVLSNDCNWGRFAITLPGLGRMNSDYFRWVDCTALDIENVLNEMFQQDVCRVYQVNHSIEHAVVPNVYGGGDPTANAPVWYYKDVFRIVFHTDYADPVTVTDVEFEVPTVYQDEGLSIVGTWGPNCFMVTNTSSHADDDYYNEAYRTYNAFVLADSSGNPLHELSIVPSAIEDQVLQFRYKLLTEYADNIYVEQRSEGAVTENLPRAVHAEIPEDMQVQFTWGFYTRSSVQEGNTIIVSPIKLATSSVLDWDSPPEVFQHALENMTPTNVADNSSPFFGAGNILVTGGLRNSNLSEDYVAAELEDSYQDLRVTLTGVLNRLPLDENEYFLRLDVYPSIATALSAVGNPVTAPTLGQNNVQYNWPYMWNDIVCRPIPPLVSERQKITIDTSDVTGDLQVLFNGNAFDVTPATTAAELEAAINAVLGEFTGSAAYSLPAKWRKAVTIYGLTIATSPMEIEFNGYGYQYAANLPMKYAVSADDGSILTITTTQEGVDPRPEIVGLSISGGPYEGSFYLTNSGNDSGTIAYNDAAATVQALVEGMTGIGAGNVVATGGPLPGEMVLTFATSLGNLAGFTSTVVAALKNQAINVSVAQDGGAPDESSITLTEVVRGAGPRFFDVPENYADNACVSSGDTVIVDDATVPIQFGLRGWADIQVKSLGDGATIPTQFIFANRRRVFLDGQKVYISASAGGTLPVGLAAGYYYIQGGTDDMTFYLSATNTTDQTLWVYCTDPGVGTPRLTLREITFKVYSRFSGQQIGLPNRRSNGELEYLPTYLSMGFTLLELGIEEGDGLNLGRFDSLDQAVEAIIHQTGTGSQSSIPAVLLLFDNVLSTLVMYDGEVGIAVYPSESSEMSTFTQHNGTLVMGLVNVVNGYSHLDGEMRVLAGTTGGTFTVA